MKQISTILATLAILLMGIGAKALPRAEYPRPQFERTSWINLNGEWDYSIDPASTGWDRGLAAGNFSDGKILVPFAPESKLSGGSSRI